jgi:hypothetical protein
LAENGKKHFPFVANLESGAVVAAKWCTLLQDFVLAANNGEKKMLETSTIYTSASR